MTYVLHQLNAHRYPTWASLARDYLAVMASSVSSERAFSSAGITISKRRNRLKGDIVEALQCMKAIYNGGLLFREVKSSSEVEKELDDQIIADSDDSLEDTLHQADEFSWDSLVIDIDSDSEEPDVLD